MALRRVLLSSSFVLALWSSSASAMTWSPPVPVGVHSPFAQTASLTNLSCPSVRLCVAIDGRVLTSTNPASGPRAWTATKLPTAITALSCPSAHLCAAVGEEPLRGQQVFVSTNPTGGAAAWAGVNAPFTTKIGTNQYSLLGVSCPSTRLCVAWSSIEVGASTNPSSPTSWKITRVESGTPDRRDHPGQRNHLVDLACSSPHLCVGVDFAGRAITSTNPAGAPHVWRYSLAHRNAKLGGVSCPTARLCIAVDRHGDVVSSTNPGARSAHWRTVHVTFTGGGFRHIRCPFAQLCIATLFDGTTMTSTDPTGTASAWTTRQTWMGYGISCPSRRYCVAVDNGPDVATSTRPSTVLRRWKAKEVDGTNGFGVLSCASASWCVTLPTSEYPFDGDLAAVSRHPDLGLSAWQVAPAPNVNALSCPTPNLCVGGDGDGNILTTTNPIGGAHAWSTAAVVPLAYACYTTSSCGDLPGLLSAVSCPTATFCVALGTKANANSVIATSTNPAGGAAAWSVSDGNAGSKLSCPTTTLCVGVGNQSASTSTHPADGASSWTTSQIDYAPDPASPCGPVTCPAQLSSVSCPSASLCVAADNAGNVLSSTNPTGGAGAWTTTNIDGTHALKSVSCASSNLCAAVDDHGNALSSTDPTGGAGAWAVTHIDDAAPRQLHAVACVMPSLCVVIDGFGNVLSGQAP